MDVDEFLFNEVGIEMSIATDSALALGNTESIVESLCSVMQSQCMEGSQYNSTLALRYKLSCYSFLLSRFKIIHSHKNTVVSNLYNVELINIYTIVHFLGKLKLNIRTIFCFKTKIDWLMPTIIQADKIVAGVANIYVKGDSSHKLPRHRWPILSAKATSSQGKDCCKVILRKKNETTQLPFL